MATALWGLAAVPTCLAAHVRHSEPRSIVEVEALASNARDNVERSQHGGGGQARSLYVTPPPLAPTSSLRDRGAGAMAPTAPNFSFCCMIS